MLFEPLTVIPDVPSADHDGAAHQDDPALDPEPEVHRLLPRVVPQHMIVTA